MSVQRSAAGLRRFGLSAISGLRHLAQPMVQAAQGESAGGGGAKSPRL